MIDINLDCFKKISSDSKPSMLVFSDVYQGLQAEDLTDSMDFAQKHVRILSGLYGILRPLDLMKPYRLEMGTKLETDKQNLYEFGEINGKCLRRIKNKNLIL